jgi:phospholipid/cholesterol/gamma-HCH transport system substrate-binding protein
MKENKINAAIAITTVLAAILMAAALSFAIGKWSFGNSGYKVTVNFPNATGIDANAQVKLAGVIVGRVTDIHIIPRNAQDKDKKNGMTNCVAVVLDIDKDVEVGQDVSATIKQDGFGIAAKYVLLTPGPDPNSPALADNATLQGDPPYDLSDLIQPAGDALMQAKQMIDQLQPTLTKLGSLTDTLNTNLPGLTVNANKFLTNGNDLLGEFNTPAGKKRLNDMLDSLRVSTENLKVVSSNAKALTATLAQKPWRVFWGGSTVTPPTENAVLDSNKVIRLKPDVDVNNDNSAPSKSH